MRQLLNAFFKMIFLEKVRCHYSTKSSSDWKARFLDDFLPKFNAESNGIDEIGEFARDQVQNGQWNLTAKLPDIAVNGVKWYEI